MVNDMIMNYLYKSFCFLFFLCSVPLFAQDRKVVVSGNNGYAFSPGITSDGLYMYYQSNTKNGYKIYNREAGDNGIVSEVKIPLDTTLYSIMGGPSYCGADSSLYFCAQKRKSGNDMDIYVSKYSKGVWQKAIPLGSSINTSDYEGFPSISTDGKILYFQRKESLDSDHCYSFFQSVKDEANNWSVAKKVAIPCKGNCDKQFKQIEWKGVHGIFFSRLPGDTSFTAFYSTLKDNGQWDDAQAWNFIKLNGEHVSIDVDAKNNMVYFSEYGTIYQQKIPFDYWINKDINLQIELIDKDSKHSVDKGEIDVFKMNGTDTVLFLHTQYSDTNTFLTLNTKGKYIIKATSDGYTQEFPFVCNVTEPIQTSWKQSIMMLPKKIEVLINVTDQESGQGLPVEIQITDLETGEKMILDVTLNKDGKYALNLREGGSYNVEISSQQGYAFVNTQVDVPLSRSRTKKSGTNTGSTPKILENDILEYTIEVKPIKKGTSLVLKDIYFGSNSIEITAESYMELDRVVELMTENPKVRIEIAAHTDDRGTDVFNNNLSLKRAQSIVQYLTSKGISGKRLIAKGYGKSKPVTSNETEEGRALNRRVELKVIDVNK
jgi:outer membrane protein OmpA-like peptidoglycan-associated protein